MRKGKAAAALPGHEVIYHILEEGNAPMGLADILRALGLPLHLKTALRASLHDMALAGVLARLPAGRLKAITGLPEIARATVTRLRADGAAYAHLTTAPDISLLLVAGLPDGTILLPGDDVLVRIRPYIAPHLRREGRPIRLLTQGSRQLPVSITALTTQPDGTCIATLQPCDSRIDLPLQARLPSHIPQNPVWCVGCVALAELTPATQDTSATVRLVSNLGSPTAPGMAVTLSILTHALPSIFSKEAEQEAQQAATKPLEAELAHRRDLRALPLITIDDETAEDFDDAIWAERTDTGFQLIVAIADVASYVPAGSTLDREARLRGNSVYLPGHCLPMLPASLSAGACSLKEHQDRLCVYVELNVSHTGALVAGTLGRGIMRSAARLTYKQVQHHLDLSPAQPSTALPATLPPDLLPSLAATAAALQSAAIARGETQQEEYGPEPHTITFDAAGTPIAFTPRPLLAAHNLVARCMIAANYFAAQTLQQKGAPGLFRIHPEAGSKHTNRPSNARYALKPARHQGLVLDTYTHFTSPIRRYADLVTHRALLATFSQTMQNPKATAPLSVSGPEGCETLHALTEHLHFTERRAASAAQMCQNRFAALYLSPACGTVLQAYVARTTRLGLSLTLTNTGTPSFLFRNAFADDSGMYDDSHPTRTPVPFGASLQKGDVLSVVLKATDPARGTLTLAVPPHAH